MQEKIGRNFNICKELDETLHDLLKYFKNDYDSPKQWKIFYQFVAKAYKVEQEERPSVSMFATILRDEGITQPGSWPFYMLIVFTQLLFTMEVLFMRYLIHKI
jgi:hypothetical protein